MKANGLSPSALVTFAYFIACCLGWLSLAFLSGVHLWEQSNSVAVILSTLMWTVTTFAISPNLGLTAIAVFLTARKHLTSFQAPKLELMSSVRRLCRNWAVVLVGSILISAGLDVLRINQSLLNFLLTQAIKAVIPAFALSAAIAALFFKRFIDNHSQ